MDNYVIAKAADTPPGKKTAKWWLYSELPGMPSSTWVRIGKYEGDSSLAFKRHIEAEFKGKVRFATIRPGHRSLYHRGKTYRGNYIPNAGAGRKRYGIPLDQHTVYVLTPEGTMAQVPL